jgi:hypothetical protein
VLARENGRTALVAVMISGESRRGEMISFAGTAGSVRRGALGDSAAYAEVRDAAVAGDERVGVAVRSLGTWRIGYFAPGPRRRCGANAASLHPRTGSDPARLPSPPTARALSGAAAPAGDAACPSPLPRRPPRLKPSPCSSRGPGAPITEL